MKNIRYHSDGLEECEFDIATDKTYKIIYCNDLYYSEYAWDGLSKWFIKQFYFTKTIATMQKSHGKSVAFFGDKRLLSQNLFLETRDYCLRLAYFLWG